jgi:serine protease Do
MRKMLIIAILATGACAGTIKPAAESAADSSEVIWITDKDVSAEFIEKLTAKMEAGKTVKPSDLTPQLERKTCSLGLAKTPGQRLDPPGIYKKCRSRVLIVGSLYKCGKCDKWHSGFAGGFPITGTGVIVTNYHVINKPDSGAIGAMTADGQIFGVKEVLAADKDEDFAIVQLDGVPDIEPFALSAGAEVGSPVALISSPNQKFYMLTQGHIARYTKSEEWVHGDHTHPGRSTMEVTLDYGVGSSGSPILNDRGAVVGMVCLTTPVFAKKPEQEGGAADKETPSGYPQMVIKSCVPASVILDAINQ